MQQRAEMKLSAREIAAGAVVAALSLAGVPLCAVAVAAPDPGAGKAFPPFSDAAAGFSIEKPEGWWMRAQDRSADSGASGNGKSNGADEAAQIAATERQMHWVRWTDPNEHAFSMEVPQGWAVQGGTSRDAGGVGHSYFLTSPQKDIGIFCFNSASLHFVVPGAGGSQPGRPDEKDGQDGFSHYMHAPEFNRFYLQKYLAFSMNGAPTVEKEVEFAPLSRRFTQQANQTTGDQTPWGVSVGMTLFKAIDKESGKPVEAALVSETRQLTLSALTAGRAYWYAEPTLLAWRSGDAQEAVRRRTLSAAYLHALQTFAISSVWISKEVIHKDEHTAKIEAQIRDAVKAADERVRQNAATGRVVVEAITGGGEEATHRPNTAFAPPAKD